MLSARNPVIVPEVESALADTAYNRFAVVANLGFPGSEYGDPDTVLTFDDESTRMP